MKELEAEAKLEKMIGIYSYIDLSPKMFYELLQLKKIQ